MGIVSPVGNTLAARGTTSSTAAPASADHPLRRLRLHRADRRRSARFRRQLIVPPKEAKKMDTFIHYGIAASFQAMDDSGLAITEANAERIGVLIGSGIGGVRGIEETAIDLHKGGPRKVSPFYVPGTIINMISGPACRSSRASRDRISPPSPPAPRRTTAIGMAMRMIQYGDADVMVAGGAETATPTSVGGFCAMRALSTRNDDPTRAVAPLGQGPRRLRARRGRRHPGAGGVRARQGPRRAHLLRAGRLRRQLRRLPHDRAAARTAKVRPAAWRWR